MKILIGLIFFINLYANINIQSYKANFEQIITNKNHQKIKYFGKIYMKHIDTLKIFWDYQKPIIKQVYIIDKKVIIIEPDLEQVILTKLNQNFNLIDILNNAKKITKNKYQATIANTIYTIIFNNNQLLSIAYKDELDNQISIIFFNSKQNIHIDNKIFNYKIPKYFDILTQ